jgi:hypothetical protein
MWVKTLAVLSPPESQPLEVKLVFSPHNPKPQLLQYVSPLVSTTPPASGCGILPEAVSQCPLPDEGLVPDLEDLPLQIE